MRPNVRLLTMTLLIGATLIFGGWSVRHAPVAIGTTIIPDQPPAPVKLATCADGCQIQWEGCSAGAAGDPDVQAVCDETRNSCLAACGPGGGGEETVTNILLDAPDPSKPGKRVVVRVKVSGTSSVPTGTVTVSGGDAPSTVTLGPDGSVHAFVTFSSEGTFTLTATYNGDGTHATSSTTEEHVVSN